MTSFGPPNLHTPRRAKHCRAHFGKTVSHLHDILSPDVVMGRALSDPQRPAVQYRRAYAENFPSLVINGP
jgi:hypothetical protein